MATTVTKTDDAFIREFLAILGALVLFAIVSYFIAGAIGEHSFNQAQNSPSAVGARIAPAGSVRLGDPSESMEAKSDPVPTQVAAAGGDSRSAEAVYGLACSACHAAAVAGAPLFGDNAQWVTRAQTGLDTLVANVINGKGAMPAKGGNPTLSEEEVREAVIYMLQEANIDLGDSAAAPDSSAQTMSIESPAAESPTADSTATAEQSAAASTFDSAAGEGIYKRACIACHAAGVAGAPKLDDTEAWKARAASGFEALMSSVVNGKGVMPARAGNPALSDQDIGNAVQYILEQAGVSAGAS